MDELSGTHIFVMSLCLLLVAGGVLVAWAKAFAAGKTGQRPSDGSS